MWELDFTLGDFGFFFWSVVADILRRPDAEVSDAHPSSSPFSAYSVGGDGSGGRDDGDAPLSPAPPALASGANASLT